MERSCGEEAWRGGAKRCGVGGPHFHDDSSASSAAASPNRSLIARGITPGAASSPIIVNVLPEPVAPYAKHAPLYPSSTARTVRFTVASYTTSDESSGPKARSKAYALSFVLSSRR